MGCTEAAAHLLAAGHIESPDERAAFKRLCNAGLTPGSKIEGAMANGSLDRTISNGSGNGLRRHNTQKWAPTVDMLQEGFRRPNENGYAASLQSLCACMRGGLIFCDVPAPAKGDALLAAGDFGEMDTFESVLLAMGVSRHSLAESSLRTLQAVMDGNRLSVQSAFVVATVLDETVFLRVCDAPRSPLAEHLGVALKEMPSLRMSSSLFRGVALGPDTSMGEFLRGDMKAPRKSLTSMSTENRLRYEPGCLVRWSSPALLVDVARSAGNVPLAAIRAHSTINESQGGWRDWLPVGLGKSELQHQAPLGNYVAFVIRRCRSARDVSGLSPRGLQSEVLLPATTFRVVALRPLTSADLCPSELRPEWLLPPLLLGSSTTISLEEASKLSAVLVVLDEEEEGVSGAVDGGLVLDSGSPH
jgi:hypothetical protein